MKVKIDPVLRVFFAGMTQSGKTTLCHHLLKGVSNLLVYDVKHEYSAFGTSVSSIAALEFAFRSGEQKVIYQPEDVTIEHFDEVCAFVRFNLRNILFVVDEVHLVATTHKITPHFKFIVTVMQGKQYKVGVWALSQRPSNVHCDVKGSCLVRFAFMMVEEIDAKATTGFDFQDILDLPEFHFLIYDGRNKLKPVTLHKPI